MKAWIIAAAVSIASPAVAEPLVYEGGEGIGAGKHVVFIANDHEYRSEQTCPLLAKILAKHHGFRCTVLFGVDDDGYIMPGAKSVPNMDALEDADLLFFFTRFMDLPDEQVEPLVAYLERGGPVVGVRTSTHCFNGQQGQWSKLNFDYTGEDYYGGLGHQVFGLTWNKAVEGQTHYGTNHVMASRIAAVDSASDHPILSGVQSIHAYSGAYKSQPPADANPLLEVQVLNTFEPSDDVHEGKPIVNAGWTRDSYVAPSGETKPGRVVYTSFGASEDMVDEDARRFLVNACLWAGGWDVSITPNLDVSIVGGYSPSPYNNMAFYYGDVMPSQLAPWDSDIMPTDSKLVGLNQPKTIRKLNTILKNRPALKAQLEQPQP
ncbi:MAG: ThuA domain-containing protein [Planctomycetota bacterium]